MTGVRTAPSADVALIARARSDGLEPGQPLSALFVGKPSDKARQFLRSITPRDRAALENANRLEE